MYYRHRITPWPVRLVVFAVVALFLVAALVDLWFILIPLVAIGAVVYGVTDARSRRR